MFRLFTPLFAELDRVSTAFSRDVSSRVIVAITPVLSAGLTVWFILWGILVMRGAVAQPVQEFLGKVVRTALIVSIALGAGLYQGEIAEVIRTTPDELAAVVAGGEGRLSFSADPLDTGGGQAALIDRAAGQGLAKAEDAFEKGGLMTQQGIAFYTFGVLLLLATVIMVGVGGALILVAKVMLALLVGLGPIFIAALLFEGTKRFFERWVAMIATYGLVVVTFAAVFTFLLAIFTNYMGGVALDGDMNVSYGIGGALLLTIVSVAILKELHHLAVGLGGGYAHRILLMERPR
ncbi:type IV secretion system protein [Anaeromyxobacter paludicola]|uniref:Trwi protein n=1 Tax=Anaeromyxobacter paludicola TaxID=2918171 RepID=A0ABM7X9W2_9BACT|nr:type IV secretion system protein [Anaeromyxobacter paludicola]BDG08633.1 trwi protein [Anaeromyxobacter paludicola]